MKTHKLLKPVVWALETGWHRFWAIFIVFSAVVLVPLGFPINLILMLFIVWLATRK